MGLLMGLILPSGTGTKTLHKLENIQLWKANPCSHSKGPDKTDRNSLCCFIGCTVCVTDTDLCANTDFHDATVSARHFWPFFMHSRCSGGHGNTCRRVFAVNVYVLGFACKTINPALRGAAI